ncbi:hypothetical protein [Streptomyces sp. NPDC059631]|uniref:hypothetical protein n=1 Tax=unclassified Streptomyces TaxID=2593676 RepID=UPI00369CC564
MRRRLRALRSALGLPERSPVELVALLHESLLRTEPGFLLLNAEEGCAYRLLDPLPRPALREVVLAHAPDTGALVAAGPDEDGASLFTWAGHALDLGLTEHARAALIRALDEIVMNQGAPRRTGAPGELDLSSLVRPAEAFDRLGDQFQALRARQSRTALDRPATTTAAVTTAAGTGRR